ncbi:hypothetical protein [Xenorhabdus bovienii]|uniref:Beta-ketoacyl synthase N-terminal domain-containing protein n=1 Tax=Xenorhabdus bovienii str. kraussei Becker Underwood TaxID=1398204 RepID=A0A077PEE0_XENBV|nr:hypothetical protein [Xenorhabdus bovienii]CDH22690.1 conserved hypothetical protein [Xenorhabdus bovienii str. kraussei Becker Underwood]
MVINRGVKLISYNVTSHHPSLNSLNYENNGGELIKNNKLRRFYSIGTEKGIISARRALMLSGLDIADPNKKFGLYTTQYGYLHPMPSELNPEQEEHGAENEHEIYQTIWNSVQVNPFLITLSLSNNLLGVLSQELSLQCDCASFLRGNIGLLSAFSEAELFLSNGMIDYALVVASGMGNITHDAQSDGEEDFVEFGVTFILAKGERPTLQDYPTIDISSLNRMYREGNHCAEAVLFINEIAAYMSACVRTETASPSLK